MTIDLHLKGATTLILCAAALVAGCIGAERVSAPESAILWHGIDGATGPQDPNPSPCGPPGETLRSDLPSSAPVRRQVDAYTPCASDYSMECSPASANWGQVVSCTYSPGSTAASVVSWTFEGSGNEYVFVENSSSYWSGAMVRGGSVTVRVDLGGEVKALPPFPVSVGPRPGTFSWASSVGGRAGTPGEIDQCFLPFSETSPEIGLVSGSSCSAGSHTGQQALFTPANPNSGGWFETTTISEGPNSGLSYVVSASATMQLRSQIRRIFRSDDVGSPLPSGSYLAQACGSTGTHSTYYVNTYCLYSLSFAMFWNGAWSHENSHLASALNAARAPQGDLHKRLHGLVLSEGALSVAASEQYELAHSHIFYTAFATHAGESIHNHTFWWNPFGVWKNRTFPTSY